MECEHVRADGIAEAYVAGRLTDADREAFEAHFLGCDTCFRRLRALEGFRALERGTEHPAFRPGEMVWGRPWLQAAAALLVLTTAAVWFLTRTREGNVPAATDQRAMPAPPAPALPGAIDGLARVEPPPFVALTMRSDEQNAFETAMEPYVRGDYQQAAARLRRIVDTDPAPPRVHFYLAASELLLHTPEQAIDPLQRVIRSGHAGYTEHARLLLAKAWLAQGRVPDARDELTACAALGGAHAAEARALLEQLGATAPR